MKKVFKLTDLCCASCASEIERAVAKTKGVSACTLNFMTQKMSVEYEEAREEDVLKCVAKIVRRVEPDCELIELP